MPVVLAISVVVAVVIAAIKAVQLMRRWHHCSACPETCVYCGYEIGSICVSVCPECGKPAISRQSTKAKWIQRRRLTASIALLILAALGTVALVIPQHAVISRIPDVALAWLAPLDDAMTSAFDKELKSRQETKTLSGSAEQVIYERIARGVRTTSGLLRIRPVWPVDIEFRPYVYVSPWLKAPGQVEIYRWLYIYDQSGQHELFSMRYQDPYRHATPARRWDDGTISVATTNSNVSPTVFVEIREQPGNNRESPSSIVLWAGLVTIPTQASGEVEDVLDFDSDPDLTAHIEANLEIGIRRWDEELWLDIAAPVQLTDVALALKIGFYHDEDLVAQVRCRSVPKEEWPRVFNPYRKERDFWEGLPDYHYGIPIDGDVETLLKASADDGTWKVVVEGDPELALRESRTDRCWQGRIELPFSRVQISER